MGSSSSALRARASRVYRSLPPDARKGLAPAMTRIRAGLRDPTVAATTIPMPMGPHAMELERDTLQAVVRVLEGRRVPYFFIPSPEPDNIRLGVPAESRPAVLSALAEERPSLVVSWATPLRFHTSQAHSGIGEGRHAPELLWVHRDPRVRTVADASDAARAVLVEFWPSDGAGGHVAGQPNAYASLVRMGSPKVEVRSRTGQVLPTFRDFAIPDMGEVHFPVDAVYLWVDDADPRWRARRDQTMRGLGIEPGHESADDARFRQHDELRYSLRSLSQHAPWIRHVYLVTDQQVPEWLDPGCARVTVIDHQDLFAGQGRLPTYNSHALSARLHHIPGIADQFLYMNDDFFFGRRTGAELWFDGNGLPRCYYTRTTADPVDLSDESPLTAARNHTFDLVQQLTGRLRRRNLQHGPYAMSRELLLDIERTIPEEFERTWSSQLRSGTDFVTERLHSQVGHGWGRTIDSRGVRYRYFNAGLPESRRAMDQGMADRWADTFCINDGEGPVPPRERGRIIQEFLAQYFPSPSEFER